MESKQSSIVAFYGQKPSSLESIVKTVQKELDALLGPTFAPRPLAEIHATLIGLEEICDATGCWNRWFLSARNQRRRMDITGLLDDLGAGSGLPIRVQLGGYRPDPAAPIVSRGQTPFHRSFSVQGDLAVLIGWPVEHQRLRLDSLRKSCQLRNCLHKYHARETDIDDDLFLVLGRVDRSAHSVDVDAAQSTIRGLLSLADPVLFELDLPWLSMVRYSDPSLPRQSTQQVSLVQTMRL
jgi:hypothetical protein